MAREYMVSSSGGDAVITLLATENLVYYLTSLSASISKSVLSSVTCNLTIKFGSTVIYTIGISDGNIFNLNEIILNETPNEDIEIKISGSSGLICCLNVAYLSYGV